MDAVMVFFSQIVFPESYFKLDTYSYSDRNMYNMYNMYILYICTICPGQMCAYASLDFWANRRLPEV